MVDQEQEATTSATEPRAVASDEGLAAVGVEPDDVPTRFLGWLAGGLTIALVLMVGFAVWFFKVSTAAELKAKGYTTTESASLGDGE